MDDLRAENISTELQHIPSKYVSKKQTLTVYTFTFIQTHSHDLAGYPAGSSSSPAQA